MRTTNNNSFELNSIVGQNHRSYVIVGNEWKTRFENQEEINRHLARQIILLERNIEQAKEEQRAGKWKCDQLIKFHHSCFFSPSFS